MKVMVTGGAGYIGNELVYRLSTEPGISEILVYDNLFKRNYNLFTGYRKVPGKNVRFIQADILDSRSLHKHMEGSDVVFHLAARVEVPFADQNPHDFEQVNHWGTAEVVYAAEELKPSRFIYLSSQSVYGQGEIDSVDAPCNPTSYYGISKLRGEDHVSRLMEQLPAQIVRCANVYGYSKNLRMESIINQLLFDAHFNNRIAVHGDHSHQLTYVSLYRAVEVLTQMVLAEMDSGTYNLSHRTLTSLDIVDALKELYPEMETIFVDQHIPMRDLTIDCDEELAAFLPEETTLAEDLWKFEEMFTF